MWGIPSVIKKVKTSLKRYWGHHIRSSPLFNKRKWKRWKKEMCFGCGRFCLSGVCTVENYLWFQQPLAECEMISGGKWDSVWTQVPAFWCVSFGRCCSKPPTLTCSLLLLFFSIRSSFKSLCRWRCQPLVWYHRRREGEVSFLLASVHPIANCAL